MGTPGGGSPRIAQARGGAGPGVLLAVIIDRQGRSAEAEPLFAEAVAAARRHLPPGHWYTGVFLSQYGRCLTNLGRYSLAGTAASRTGCDALALRKATASRCCCPTCLSS